MALNHKRVSTWGAWSGVIFTFGFLVAVSPWFGGNIPVTLSPMDSPETVKAYFVTNRNGILWGAFIGMIASAFWYVWGGAVAALLRRTENGRPPILFATQVAATGVAVFSCVFHFFWLAFCAYRADTMDPVLLRHLNDFMYIQLVFLVFPLSLWAITIGCAILIDRSKTPVFPRWVAWANFWFAGLVLSGAGVIFSYDAPFPYSVWLTLYEPAFVFFFWIIVMSFSMLKNIKHGYGVRPEMRTEANQDYYI